MLQGEFISTYLFVIFYFKCSSGFDIELKRWVSGGSFEITLDFIEVLIHIIIFSFKWRLSGFVRTY